eukprot:scaffold167737_cov45-Prasinocladus_malaysianus.AAC.1
MYSYFEGYVHKTLHEKTVCFEIDEALDELVRLNLVAVLLKHNPDSGQLQGTRVQITSYVGHVGCVAYSDMCCANRS